MRRILFVLALLTALVPTTGNRASAQVAPLAPFSGYSTGTAVHAGALESLPTRLVDTELAFSGANVNSSGLGAALTNEMAQAYQSAAEAGDKAAGRGSGLEIGVATTVPNLTGVNQINPGSTVQAFAPTSTELLTKEFVPVDLNPVVSATTLRGQAQAIYADSVCVLGQPISSGLGYAANANLVNTGTPLTSLLATSTGANAVSQSKSFTYLIPNGNGTYGLVTETRQILAPITLGGVAGIPLVTIELLGEWVLRTTATGMADGAKIDYAPGADPSSTTPVLTIKAAGILDQTFTAQQFLTQKGVGITLPAGLGEIAIGEAPRAIGGAMNSSPTMTADGTSAAAAVDVVRIQTGLAGILGITDLRVGHMESMATVPVGGIQCGIPVTKTGNPTTVTAGDAQTVTYTITVPADPEAFKVIACDIVNLKVVDVISTDSPLVKFNILSASAPGVISGGNTVTWDLGTYKPGDPAKVLTVTMDVPADSAAGKITDVATATAVLGNCQGNASANATSLTGLAKLEAAAVTGSASLVVPGTTVLAGQVVPSATGPTPVGGVQTGAGGTSQGSGRLLPIGMALGSMAVLGTLAAQRRRQYS